MRFFRASGPNAAGSSDVRKVRTVASTATTVVITEPARGAGGAASTPAGGGASATAMRGANTVASRRRCTKRTTSMPAIMTIAMPVKATASSWPGSTSAKNCVASGTVKTSTRPMNMAPTTSTLKRLSGRASTASTQMPTTARMIVAPVRSCSSLTPMPFATKVYHVRPSATMMPAGMAKLNERRRKPGTYRCVFGIRARKNAGMPIVRPSVIDSWRGRKGNSSTRMPKSSASPVA